MAVFRVRKTDPSERLQALVQQTSKKLGARSKYLGHMAAAQSYRAAAGARSGAGRASGYLRHNRMTALGVLAAIASLIAYLMFRRKNRNF